MKLAFLAGVLAFAVLWLASFDIFKGKTEEIASQKYDRIVSLAPSMTETLIWLGQAHRIVGTTIHCEHSETAKATKIGSFGKPNFEAILSLNPDLVVAVPHIMAKDILAALKAHRIEVFAHQPDRLSDIKYINRVIAEKLGVPEQGSKINAAIDHALFITKKNLGTLAKRTVPLTTLIAVSPTPFVVAGINTFASEVVAHMGLSNMATDHNLIWPIWPLEELLRRPPDILLLTDGAVNFVRYKQIFAALGLDRASCKMRVISPKRLLFSSPSPEVIKDCEYLSQLLLEKNERHGCDTNS